MSDRGLVESANDFALQLASFFFDYIIPNQERVRLNRKLEEVANEMGISVSTLKTWMGFILMAGSGYLVFLNLFFFALPIAFLFLLLVFIGYVAVRGLLCFLLWPSWVNIDHVLIP